MRPGDREAMSSLGIEVAIGARVDALAGPSEVLVSQTVKDLVVGSGLVFEDRGVETLKAWRMTGTCTLLSATPERSPDRSRRRMVRETKGTPMTPDPDRMLDFARRYTAAWCSQEPASVAAHYAPEGSLTINDGAPSVGRAAITEAARSFMTAFPDMQVLMDDLILEDPRIEYHWTLVGTNTGPGGTGNRVRISGFEEWTISEDVEIAASLGHYDQAEYNRQVAHGVDG